MSTNLVKSVVFHRSEKRDLRSKKRDKASKSGTYGNHSHTKRLLKMVFTASLLGAQRNRDGVENKPASLLVVS